MATIQKFIDAFNKGDMRESAQMTFVLKKGPTGWLIHSWTWNGPKPQ